MSRVAPIAAVVAVMVLAGAVQAQYYTTYYAPTTVSYGSGDCCCGNVQTATVTTAYYAPTTTYYTPTTTYYAPTTTYYAPATTYYAARPVTYYPTWPRYTSFYRWW
jgi:hypothetical protein